MVRWFVFLGVVDVVDVVDVIDLVDLVGVDLSDTRY